MVFGNKTDLEEHRQVSKEEAQEYFVKDHGCLWMEGSVLDGEGVEEMIQEIVHRGAHGTQKLQVVYQ